MLPWSLVAKSWFNQVLIWSAALQWLCAVDLLMAQRMKNTLDVHLQRTCPASMA